MKEFLQNLDIQMAEYISRNIKNDTLDRILSRTNRGEVMGFLVIPPLFLSGIPDPWFALLFTLVITFLNDRAVLVIKKKISRKRPSLKILGKENNHPDYNHSFPSAHAANSMVVAVVLVVLFQQTPFLFLLSLIAGVGRLISLHHFLSDVLGGWVIGTIFGIFGVLLFRLYLILG